MWQGSVAGRGASVMWCRELGIAVLFSLLFVGVQAFGAGDNQFSISPKTNNGAKWRIGYYEGGSYEAYYKRLAATVEGLMELGWVKTAELPRSETKDSRALWDWLVANADSDYVEFAEEGFVSALWDDERRAKVATELTTRLREKRDLDLMLALGTRAGQDLASDEHSVPTIVITSTDPVKSGIIDSADDSGRDHIHARVDPARNARQVSIFYDIVGFKRLGVAFENSAEGRNYAAVEEVEAVARKRGFEVVECHTLSDIPALEVAGGSVVKCFNELAAKSDAIYVTMQGGVNRDTIPELVSIANQHRLPTLSQIGEDGVRFGFLMSVSIPFSSKKSGRYYASVIARVFNGAKPRDIGQVSEESPNIALNLKSAEIVGLYLQADILAAADNVYPTIEAPK